MAIATAYLLYLGRGLNFFNDEWEFIYNRRGWAPGVFLVPHNEHLSALPLVLYKTLFVTVGLGHYWIYRLVVVGVHLICVALVFALARRRVGDGLALAGTVAILFLGSAWEDLLWPFQVGLIASVAAGLGMLLMLDRRDRRGDLFACLLLAVSLASGSVGLAMGAAAAVEVLLGPKRWRRLWIVAVPLALYACWYLRYGRSQLEGGGSLSQNLTAIPAYGADAAAAAVGGLTGLGFDWGRMLGLLAVVVAVRALLRTKQMPVRFLSLLAAAVSFWALTALARAHLGDPMTSRYIYVGAILIVLMAFELARDIRLSRSALVAVGLLVAIAVVGNAHMLRKGGRDFRVQDAFVSAELGALEVAGPAAPPNFIIDPTRPWLIAGPYRQAAAALGSPADRPADVAARPDAVSQAADAGLARAFGIAAAPGTGMVKLGGAPAVVAGQGGTARARGSCVELRPTGTSPTLDVAVPQEGLLVRPRRPAPVSISLRRYAHTFPPTPFATVNSPSQLRLPRGKMGEPWFVRLATTVPIEICGISA